MGLDEVLERVRAMPVRLVEFTGGEPLLQPAVMHPPVAHEEIEIVATISCADRPTSAIMHLADLAFLLRRSLAGRGRVARNPRILVDPVGFPGLASGV